ncbi:hypothetical protein PCANC_04950 [Puccinia coronata f. sp. avenae]|uniref:Uncharacterized protein n=1 Tax=Puccinia coronata f. sp. avenae TaxID=200324 RepID=A0A2N5VWK8_9BASI|nr:hypothetical protein PCANC_23568 [Puccinia coronata f. sp. avenae]PLW54342.1 hypothetical protein PCANC_04950 [Puccinia coronata f. sp. avenae]
MPATATGSIWRMTGHLHCVYSYNFSLIGTLLVAGSFVKSVSGTSLQENSSVTSLATASLSHALAAQSLPKVALATWTIIAFTPNLRHLVNCLLDSTIRIWDYKSKKGIDVKSYMYRPTPTFLPPLDPTKIPASRSALFINPK